MLGESTTKLRIFDPTAQLQMETEQSGYTATGDNQHIVVLQIILLTSSRNSNFSTQNVALKMMRASEVGRIGSTRGKSTVLYGSELTFEVKALMLAATVWMVGGAGFLFLLVCLCNIILTYLIWIRKFWRERSHAGEATKKIEFS